MIVLILHLIGWQGAASFPDFLHNEVEPWKPMLHRNTFAFRFSVVNPKPNLSNGQSEEKENTSRNQRGLKINSIELAKARENAGD